MNNDLKISMKLVSSDNINMKLEDNKPIDANMTGGVIETDPIFVNSPAYTITYNDINIWNHKSDFSGNYNDLINKPIIPTDVGQLTNNIGYITKSVTNLEYYTRTSNLANVALTGDFNDLINTPTIPTKTSDLNNDSGFITNTVDNLTNYTLSSSLATVATTGSYSDLTNAPTLSTVATTGFYSDLINKPTIPSQTSQLTNDSGFITISDIPAIPTKTSELNNDSGFITKSVNDLTNYTLSSNLSSVATSGSYNDLSNKPTIPTASTLNVYSTTEQIVGTWLGKPLYRKVIEDTTPTTTDGNLVNKSIPINVSNVNFIYINKALIVGSSTYNCNTLVSTMSFSNGVRFEVNTSNVVIYSNSGVWSNLPVKIVIEYTKTTD